MKEKIREIGLELGADAVGFAAATDYRSPLSPPLDTIFPGAATLIVLAFREGSHCESPNMSIAMGGRLGISDFIKSTTHKLSRVVERDCGARAMMMPLSYPMTISPESKFGLIADFSHRHAAVAAGLGNWGRHNLVVHPTLGARVLFSTILTDLAIPPDAPVTEEVCTNCRLCVKHCPAGALDEEGKTDQMKCLSHSQPYGTGATIRFWTRFVDSSSEQQKEMLRSVDFMRLRQASFIGLQYHCFSCYAVCPIGKNKGQLGPVNSNNN